MNWQRLKCRCTCRTTAASARITAGRGISPTVRVPGVPEGTLFVPGTADAHVSLTSISTSTSHVTLDAN